MLHKLQPQITFYILYFLIIITPNTYCQSIGNEWINFNQQYFKIKITQKGIYQINYNDLKSAGFPVSINPQKIQLFRNGNEQAIFIKGEEDKQLNEGDFIEFYAEGNGGSLDSAMYYPTKSQPHQYYSLYTDTASYFLTYHLDNQIGKRENSVQKTNTENIKPESFHLEESLQLFTSSYTEGQPEPIGTSLNSGVLNSNYSYGKGWTGEILKKNTFINFDFILKNVIKSRTTKPVLEILLTGRSTGEHAIETWLGKSSTQHLVDTILFDNYFTNKRSKILNFQDISNDTLRVSTRSVGSLNDQYSVSYLKLIYPQNFDMKGVSEKVFNLAKNVFYERLISIPNSPLGVQLYDITDKNNIQKIGFTQKENSIECVVSGNQILATNQFKKVISIEPVKFKDISKSRANYLIINHNSLSKTVKEYASYRASTQGGNYDTLSVDIDLLYNLFTYGDKNPLAIKRFLNYMMRISKPQFVFLIGTSSYPQRARKNVADYQIDLVPNVGYPSADVPFTMGLNSTEPNFMSLGIGRLATNNPQTVLDYLKKVKEHESSPMDALWRKKSLKMSGGRTPYEISTFKDYIKDFKQVCETGLLGEKVDLLAKKTDNPVEFINVTERVNEGVGMITLFGHASSGQADMDIGYCSNELLGYKNKGKYPFVLVNGCDAGDLFGTRSSFGTDWINTPDKGAILFLAHSNLGYPSILKTYSDEIYHTLFTDSSFSDKPFGTVMQESVNRYLKKYPNSIYELANAQQLTLQGDPAVALFPTQNPDYETNSTSIFIKNVDANSPLNSNADSLKIGIVISNLGRISSKKFNLKLNRIYASGVVDSFEKLNINPINFQDTVYLNILNDKNLSIGNNRFEVVLDPDNQIIEANKKNNLAVLDYNFPSANIGILLPREFSIVNQKEVNFILQIPENNHLSVIIELDSSKKFNSNFKKSYSSLGMPLLNWKTNILEKDSIVYYLRTKFSNENSWTESSFIYIKNGTEGFAQNSIPQLAKTTTDNQILLDETGWRYASSNLKISAKVYGGNSGILRPHLANSLIINDKQLIGNGVCYPWNNLNAIAFNRALRPYSVIPSLVCGYTPYSVNYLSTDAKSTDLSDYLNATNTGNYVILWNSGYLYYDNFSFENLQKLQDLGVDLAKIEKLSHANGSPFLVIGRKGAKKALLELFPDFDKYPSGEILTLDNYEIKDQFNEGTITSPLIGPASEWGDISLKIQQENLQSFFYDIIGVNAQGEETTLQKKINSNSLNINKIEAKRFPFLKLKLTLNTSEEFGKTPQLKSWIVTYKGVPEGIIDVKQSSIITDKQEYENFTASVWFKNISDKSFKDSITVRQVLSNRSLGKSQTKIFKIKALNALDSVNVSIPIQTAELVGNNTLSLVFNPQIQPEQIYNNNSIDYHFSVIPDKINPILSVTFDGRQIQNNEIVSAKPLIQINLKDENLFRIRTDTTGLEMSLKSCKTCSFQRIHFSNSEISWKADTSNNDFTIKYLPQNLREDTLTLQVQGRDLAGNLAGNQPYQISFRIIQKNELKSWLVYPNPFEFFTKFSFTLTGTEIPRNCIIEIYDELGQIVKSINATSQFLHIGINEFIWDGTDSSGKKLPSGAYFYWLSINGITESSGKIVILR